MHLSGFMVPQQFLFLETLGEVHTAEGLADKSTTKKGTSGSQSPDCDFTSEGLSMKTKNNPVTNNFTFSNIIENVLSKAVVINS